MVREALRKIFEKVQSTTASHQKYIILLMDLYIKTPPEEFLTTFLKFLQIAIFTSIDNSLYTKRVLSFVSKFCADVTKKEQRKSETHDFLISIMEKVLQWSCLNEYNIRYNSCCFIASVLQDIGEEVQLEINLIDEIQNALLERMQEPKVPIREVAMSALVRLQDPQNFECPVINAYIEALSSGSAIIRKDAIGHIAPNKITVSKIIDRVRDVDPSVRSVAFHKCADIGPLSFRIADKHLILLCGFKETNEKVRNTFIEYLLPKWLTAYKGDYLKFVSALKLIADEEDIKKMMYLSRELIKEFYNKHPLDELIGALPINDEKLLNVEHLNNDITLFWNILVGLLRDSENMDDYLNQILPEMTPFCHYIDKIVKMKSSEKMDEWKDFEYQFDLLNLFEIAEDYDYADEVGRRTMQSLVTALLQKKHFTYKLAKKLVIIAHKCSSNNEIFTNDMCQLISEIREPLMEEPLSEDQNIDKNFKIAQLKVKINVVTEGQNVAISERNYEKAQQFENELKSLNEQLENLQSQSNKVRVAKSDNETLCWCLDILGSVLELPSVSKLTPSLITCKDHFLVPLICHQDADVHWRVMKCLALYSVIDKATAEEYAKVICIPLATYRTIPVNNVSALVQSICGVTDLISIYGVDIVSEGEEVSNTTSEQNGKRKLYTTENDEDGTRIDNVTVSYIFEIFLDMLDDERDEVRHKAILAISALVKESFPVTPTLLSRILLKWYNPLTEKQDSRLQVYLGLFIDQYVHLKNSGEVVKEALFPTLNSIARAPRTSPLVDIDINNVLMFFSEIINITLQKDDLRILALDICMKISETTSDRIVPLLAKFLCHLDIDRKTDTTSMTELIERSEMLLENNLDKISKRYIEKFISKLKQKLAQETINSTNQTNITTNTESNGNINEQSPRVLQVIAPDSVQNRIKEPQQVKRRKSRNSKNCVVLLERLNLAEVNGNKSDQTTLHTIIETSMEMETDNNLTVDCASSDSTKSSKNSTRNNTVVVSETSDSDFSNGSENQRKSTRIRKKRILLDY